MGGPGTIGELDVDPILAASLRSGLETLDQRATFDFKKYKRVVLPVDGFVFWQPTGGKVTVNGSLHFAQEWVQEADQAIGLARVILTSENQIQEFGTLGKNEIWVCTYKVQGKNAQDTFRFAFSAQTGFYTQASLWHYVGYQIPPALLTQLLDPGNTIDQTRAVVSNSIPLWLALNGYAPPYPGYQNNVPIFPSFQAAENQAAPYIVVEVLETEALQAVPAIGIYGEHTQWVKDTCRLTLYGLQNNEALTFQDVINQYSLDTDNFGIMNMPVVKDVHRVSPELHGIAMKKEMLVEISYDQQKTTSTAHQLIKSALYNFFISELFPPLEGNELQLIPFDIAQRSVLGANGLVAGIISEFVDGTTANPPVWAKYVNGGTTQAINLIAALNSINSGSGVDWSFLEAATQVELEWSITLTLAAGETHINPGHAGIDVNTQNAASFPYSVISTVTPASVPEPVVAETEIQLSGTTIAPVENGLIHLIVGIQPLLVGSNAFSQGGSNFSVTCRVAGWQI